MMLRATGLAYLLVLATAVLSAHGATNTTKETPPYYCTTDEDCAAFPDTVCITVESKDTISKCTPNTVARPACRAGQFGLCPSYQDTQRGYLNAHCIFVADDSVAPASATAARRLATNATATSAAGTVKPAETAETTANTTTTTASRAPLTIAPTTDGDGEGSSDVAPADTTTVGDTSGSAVAVASAKFKVGNQTVYGIFKCADLSECDTLAADPTTCRPAKCGSANSITQCNNQGTCTHTSKQDIKMRSCMCYKGYSGSKCEKTVSNACDVDCGVGGNCVDGECVCKAGFDGKKYKNKQGKSDARCTKCTNDLGCENNNACNIELGTCTCEAGFTGPTCGGVEDSCVTKNCGKGNCNVINDKAVCQCPICSPECETCPTKDCSTCPSAASSVTVSVAVLLVAAVTALLMN